MLMWLHQILFFWEMKLIFHLRVLSHIFIWKNNYCTSTHVLLIWSKSLHGLCQFAGIVYLMVYDIVAMSLTISNPKYWPRHSKPLQQKSPDPQIPFSTTQVFGAMQRVTVIRVFVIFVKPVIVGRKKLSTAIDQVLSVMITSWKNFKCI